jgi:Rieske 2Fe-2S family protein
MSTKQQQQLQATLPRECYVSEAHLRLEREAIFYREWFCAGRVEGLESKGDYRLVDILGESILIVCDEHAAIRAFNNVCRHRGAELVRACGVAEQTGTFVAGIRCPYHSWNYRLDGVLHSTPKLNIDKPCLGLHQVETDTCGGFVFVRVANGDQPLLAMLGEIPERIERYALQDLQVGHRIDYVVDANWKVILENYNECYHCAGVHPELCKLVPAFRDGGTNLDWDRGIEHRGGANTFTMSGTSNRPHLPNLDEDEQHRHKGELAYPNLMLSLSRDHVASFTLWPRTPIRTDIVCEFLFHPDAVSRADFDPSDAVEFWDLVNQQDWDICASVQRGMRSRAFTSGYYGPMEDLSLDIRDYVRRRLDRDR